MNSYRYTPLGLSPKGEEFFYKRKRTECSHRSASAYGDRREASDPHHPSCSEAARVHAEHEEAQGARDESLLAFFFPLFHCNNSQTQVSSHCERKQAEKTFSMKKNSLIKKRTLFKTR